MHFKDLPDPRQVGKIVYRFDEVLLSLLVVLAGAETFTDIALFGEKKLGFLRRYRPFACGTPPHDRIGDIFAVLDAGQFHRCFVSWVAALTGVPEGVVAIDGKTVRRLGGKSGAKAPIHMVSAFAARQRLVMRQVKVAEKSNEIAAIPRLLDMLAIEGAVVTIDSMGCQRAIASKILAKKADYILALKGNQGTLHEDVKLLVAEQQANDFKQSNITRHETVDGGHGRIETRKTTVLPRQAPKAIALQCRMAAKAPRLARAARRRGRRRPAGVRWRHPARDEALHHLADARSGRRRAGRP